MAEKVYIAVIKANLDCYRCCRNIRKVLSKFPEIRSQVFDEKQKTVTVTGNFDPQRLECKLRCKAGKSICSIEIKELEKKKDKPPPLPAPPAEKGNDKPNKDTKEKEKEGLPPAQAPLPGPPLPLPAPPPPQLPKVLEPVQPALPPAPPGACCRPCYDGNEGHYCANRFFSEEDGNCRTM